MPACLSGYFYNRISRVILSRDRDAGRNRNLSIAFTISWFVWVLSWVPNYLLIMFDQPTFKNGILYSLYKYLSFYRVTLQMIASQSNPVFLLIVVKPFQVYMRGMFSSILMRKVGDPKLDSYNKSFTASSDRAEGAKKNKFKFVCSCLVIFSIITALSFTTLLFITLTSTASHKLAARTENSKWNSNMLKQRSLIEFENLGFSPRMLQPETSCELNNGKFSKEFKSCWFLDIHPGKGSEF